ncbi:MAG: hypothetical protein ABIV94_03560 [Acidimicrobiales bacterium]
MAGTVHRRAARPLVVAVVVVAAALITVALVYLQPSPRAPGAAVGAVIPALARGAGPVRRTVEPYAGLGAWVDGFDYGAAYQRAGAAPSITPDVIDDLAAHGVRTLYLQAAREDTRTPEGIVDPATTAEMLVRAHRVGMAVVAWYLPRFRDPAKDLANLRRLDRFAVLGHRFDGIAVDIEFTDDVPDTDERNALIIEMTATFKADLGGDTLGAIVLPPVQTEVINTTLWPDFPWRALAPYYDVWMPMSYWTFRSEESGYADGYTYNEESTRRLRTDLGDPDAAIHGIGGIGDLVTTNTLDGFARSLAATGSIGGSIYDWDSMTEATRDELATRFATGGLASDLPDPPIR